MYAIGRLLNLHLDARTGRISGFVPPQSGAALRKFAEDGHLRTSPESDDIECKLKLCCYQRTKVTCGNSLIMCNDSCPNCLTQENLIGFIDVQFSVAAIPEVTHAWYSPHATFHSVEVDAAGGKLGTPAQGATGKDDEGVDGAAGRKRAVDGSVQRQPADSSIARASQSGMPGSTANSDTTVAAGRPDVALSPVSEPGVPLTETTAETAAQKNDRSKLSMQITLEARLRSAS